MRYIEVPQDVHLTAFASGNPMIDQNGAPYPTHSMKLWLLTLIVADPDMAENGRKGLRAVRTIRKAFAEAKAGDVVALEDDPWERGKAIIEKQAYARKVFLPTALEQFMEFCDAWLDAKDTPPPRTTNTDPAQERATA